MDPVDPDSHPEHCLKLDELLDVDVLEEGAGLVVHGRRQAQEEAQLTLRVGLRQNLGAAREMFDNKLIKNYSKFCCCKYGYRGRWVAKLVAQLLATAALWVRIRTSPKNTNGRHKQRSKQHNLARQNIENNIQKV